MNIKQLKDLIADAPDSMPVLMPATDHAYRPATAERTTALKERGGSWTEDHGEELTPQKTYGKRSDVLIISYE